jgi:hypothetical protein
MLVTGENTHNLDNIAPPLSVVSQYDYGVSGWLLFAQWAIRACNLSICH